MVVLPSRCSVWTHKFYLNTDFVLCKHHFAILSYSHIHLWIVNMKVGYKKTDWPKGSSVLYSYLKWWLALKLPHFNTIVNVRLSLIVKFSFDFSYICWSWTCQPLTVPIWCPQFAACRSHKRKHRRVLIGIYRQSLIWGGRKCKSWTPCIELIIFRIYSFTSSSA